MPNIPHVIETALLLLVAYLIGCVTGYFLRAKVFRSEKPVTKPDAAPAQPKIAEAASSAPAADKPAPKSRKKVAAGAPEGLSEPREGKADNLKLIKGVGPKIEGKLNEMGIYHFDQVAAWDSATIAWVDEHLSFKGRIQRERWVSQAKELAE